MRVQRTSVNILAKLEFNGFPDYCTYSFINVEEKQCSQNLILWGSNHVSAPESGQSPISYRLEDEWIEDTPAEKDMEILVDKKLNISWQCVAAVQKANPNLGCIEGSVASRSKEMFLSLYSDLIRPQLESCIQLWGLQEYCYRIPGMF